MEQHRGEECPRAGNAEDPEDRRLADEAVLTEIAEYVLRLAKPAARERIAGWMEARNADEQEAAAARAGVTRHALRMGVLRAAGAVRRVGGALWTAARERAEAALDDMCPEKRARALIAHSFEENRELAGALCRWALEQEIDRRVAHGISANGNGRRRSRRLAARARQAEQDGVCLLEAATAGANEQSGRRQARLLLRYAGMALHGSRIVVRNNNQARAVAALHELGREASPREIADAAGMKEHAAHRALWRTPAVARSAKDRWALREWGREAFEGAVPVAKRMVEAGGSGADRQTVIDTLVSEYGLKRAGAENIARRPCFRTRNGRLEIEPDAAGQGLPLEKAADGFDENGEPYILRRGRRLKKSTGAASVPHIGAALARHAGARHGGRTPLQVAEPAGMPAVRLRWDSARMNSPGIYGIEPVVERLGIEDDDVVRITIGADLRVRFRKVYEQIPRRKRQARSAAEWAARRKRTGSATARLALMVEHELNRRGLTEKEAAGLLGLPFDWLRGIREARSPDVGRAEQVCRRLRIGLRIGGADAGMGSGNRAGGALAELRGLAAAALKRREREQQKAGRKRNQRVNRLVAGRTISLDTADEIGRSLGFSLLIGSRAEAERTKRSDGKGNNVSTGKVDRQERRNRRFPGETTIPNRS